MGKNEFNYIFKKVHMNKQLNLMKQTLRLLDILQDSHYIYRAKDLQKELGVGERQIRNYIKTLRECGVNIQSDASVGGGYQCLERYYRIPYHITEEEVDQLERVKNFYEQNNMNEDIEHLYSLYHKIKHKKKSLMGQLASEVTYKYLEKQKNESDFQKNCKKILSKAMEGKFKVRISYSGNYDLKEEIRVVHPYAFTLYKNAYYVEAYCEKAKAHRSFKLARILDLECLDKTFKIKKDLLNILKQDGQGLYREKSYRLRAIFKQPFNKYIEETDIGFEKITKQLSSTYTLLEVRLDNWTETLTWLQSFSHHVEVIEPAEMRQAIIANIKENLKIYSSVNENSGTMSSAPMRE